jgi:hypothetical protein
VTADASAAPDPPQTFFRRHRLTLVSLAVLFTAAGVVALWTIATLMFSYSSGDRIGYIQKLSRRGWICRTWEGELAMSPVPGATPQIFSFTIPQEAVAKKITDLEGKKVSLHYEEKRGIPNSCFGDTRYFVTDIRVLPQ